LTFSAIIYLRKILAVGTIYIVVILMLIKKPKRLCLRTSFNEKNPHNFILNQTRIWKSKERKIKLLSQQQQQCKTKITTYNKR